MWKRIHATALLMLLTFGSVESIQSHPAVQWGKDQSEGKLVVGALVVGAVGRGLLLRP